jgi:putative endonuclease
MGAFCVYILANRAHVLYIGQTPNLHRRLEQHRPAWSGYSARHQTKRLVYYEYFKTRETAIQREKQLKKWRRSKKLALIESKNPGWKNLSP